MASLYPMWQTVSNTVRWTVLPLLLGTAARIPSWNHALPDLLATAQEQGARPDEQAPKKARTDAKARQKAKAAEAAGAAKSERPSAEQGEAKPKPKGKPKPKRKGTPNTAGDAGKQGADKPARKPKAGGGGERGAGKPGAAKGAPAPPVIVKDDGRTKIKKAKPKTNAELSRELLLDIRDNRVRLARIEALIQVFLEQGRVDRFHYLEDLRRSETARFQRARGYYRKKLGEERFFKQLAVASGDENIGASAREATEFRKKLEAEALRQEEERKKAANRDLAARRRELAELVGRHNPSKTSRGRKVAQLKLMQQRAAKKKAAQAKVQKQRAARQKAAQAKAAKKRAAKKRAAEKKVAQRRAAKKRAADGDAGKKVAQEEGDGSPLPAPEGKRPSEKRRDPKANQEGAAQKEPVPASTNKTKDPKKGGAPGRKPDETAGGAKAESAKKDADVPAKAGAKAGAQGDTEDTDGSADADEQTTSDNE